MVLIVKGGRAEVDPVNVYFQLLTRFVEYQKYILYFKLEKLRSFKSIVVISINIKPFD